MTREELYFWLHGLHETHFEGIASRLDGEEDVGEKEIRRAIVNGAEELDYLIHQLGKEGVH